MLQAWEGGMQVQGSGPAAPAPQLLMAPVDDNDDVAFLQRLEAEADAAVIAAGHSPTGTEHGSCSSQGSPADGTKAAQMYSMADLPRCNSSSLVGSHTAVNTATNTSANANITGAPSLKRARSCPAPGMWQHTQLAQQEPLLPPYGPAPPKRTMSMHNISTTLPRGCNGYSPNGGGYSHISIGFSTEPAQSMPLLGPDRQVTGPSIVQQRGPIDRQLGTSRHSIRPPKVPPPAQGMGSMRFPQELPIAIHHAVCCAVHREMQQHVASMVQAAVQAAVGPALDKAVQQLLAAARR